MRKEFRQIMIPIELKTELDNVCTDIGKQTYSNILRFLLKFYMDNKGKV